MSTVENKQADETTEVAIDVETNLHSNLEHKMTEDNFVLGYLPLFMAIAKDRDIDYKSRPDYQKWVQNTVNGLREVAVVDNEDNNKILFIVPPINSITADYTKTNEIPFNSIMNEVEKLNNYIPGNGNAFFMKKVIRPLQEAMGTGKNPHMETWKTIFSRYSGKVYEPYDKRLIIPDVFTTKYLDKKKVATPTGSSLRQLEDNTDDLW